MKKLLTIILITLFVLTGCSKYNGLAANKDPQEIYQEAYDKMLTLESITMKQEASVKIKAEDSELAVDYVTTFKSNNTDCYSNVKMSYLGMEIELEEWIINGNAYVIQNGDYYYMEGVETDLMTFNNLLMADYIESYLYSQENGKDVVTIVLSMEGIQTAFGQLIENQVGMDDLSSLEFSPVKIVIADGFIEAIEVSYSADIEGNALSGTLIATYSDYNQTVISEPDYSLWETADNSSDASDDYVIENDIELDITADDSKKLENLGFTAFSDDYYENEDGTIGLDLKWKFLYYMEDDYYVEYDWEYDIGMDYSVDDHYCTIDFELNEIDEECTSEQSKLLYSVRNAFIDIYNSINQ